MPCKRRYMEYCSQQCLAPAPPPVHAAPPAPCCSSSSALIPPCRPLSLPRHAPTPLPPCPLRCALVCAGHTGHTSPRPSTPHLRENILVVRVFILMVREHILAVREHILFEPTPRTSTPHLPLVHPATFRTPLSARASLLVLPERGSRTQSQRS
jgi:hypothetical protein